MVGLGDIGFKFFIIFRDRGGIWEGFLRKEMFLCGVGYLFFIFVV